MGPLTVNSVWDCHVFAASIGLTGFAIQLVSGFSLYVFSVVFRLEICHSFQRKHR